jgi:hypothetical protein
MTATAPVLPPLSLAHNWECDFLRSFVQIFRSKFPDAQPENFLH